MPAAVSIKGLDELRSALRQAGDDGLKRALASANKSAAQIVVDAALPNVPRRTGKLAQSVRALGSQRSGRAVAGRAGVVYAPSIHWGRKVGNVGSPPGNHLGPNAIAGRPFLWDAAQRRQVQIARQYERDIEGLVRSVFGG